MNTTDYITKYNNILNDEYLKIKDTYDNFFIYRMDKDNKNKDEIFDYYKINSYFQIEYSKLCLNVFNKYVNNEYMIIKKNNLISKIKKNILNIEINEQNKLFNKSFLPQLNEIYPIKTTLYVSIIALFIFNFLIFITYIYINEPKIINDFIYIENLKKILSILCKIYFIIIIILIIIYTICIFIFNDKIKNIELLKELNINEELKITDELKKINLDYNNFNILNKDDDHKIFIITKMVDYFNNSKEYEDYQQKYKDTINKIITFHNYLPANTINEINNHIPFFMKLSINIDNKNINSKNFIYKNFIYNEKCNLKCYSLGLYIFLNNNVNILHDILNIDSKLSETNGYLTNIENYFSLNYNPNIFNEINELKITNNEINNEINNEFNNYKILYDNKFDNNTKNYNNNIKNFNDYKNNGLLSIGIIVIILLYIIIIFSLYKKDKGTAFFSMLIILIMNVFMIIHTSNLLYIKKYL